MALGLLSGSHQLRQKRETKYRKQMASIKKQPITANKQTNKTAKNIYLDYGVVDGAALSPPVMPTKGLGDGVVPWAVTLITAEAHGFTLLLIYVYKIQ